MSENITGTLHFRDIEFYFLFEKGILNLYPNIRDLENVGSWFLKEISEGLYVDGPLPLVVEDYIKATTTTGKTCFFFPYLKSVITYSNYSTVSNLGMILYIRVQSYLLSPASIEQIASIEFFSPELNLFYSIHDVIHEIKQKNSLTVKYDYSKEFSSGQTQFKLKNIDWYVEFNRFLTEKLEVYQSPTFSMSTEMKLTPAEELNISILPEIYRTMKRFMAFCSHRNNVAFSKVKVTFNESGYPYPIKGDYFVLTDKNQEPDLTALKNNRIIHYQDIEESLGLLLQDIIEGNIYLRSLPKDSEDARQYDIAKFIMVAAGFDSEFKRKFLTLDYCFLTEIRNNFSKTNNWPCPPKKEGIRSRKNNANLREKMVYAHSYFENVLDPLLSPQYRDPNYPYNIYQFAKRVAQQRNNFAHGDLTQETDLEAFNNLRWLEVLVFVMQLSHYSVTDLTLKAILRRIFSL